MHKGVNNMTIKVGIITPLKIVKYSSSVAIHLVISGADYLNTEGTNKLVVEATATILNYASSNNITVYKIVIRRAINCINVLGMVGKTNEHK
jgi:hypothetical protein